MKSTVISGAKTFSLYTGSCLSTCDFILKSNNGLTFILLISIRLLVKSSSLSGVTNFAAFFHTKYNPALLIIYPEIHTSDKHETEQN